MNHQKRIYLVGQMEGEEESQVALSEVVIDYSRAGIFARPTSPVFILRKDQNLEEALEDLAGFGGSVVSTKAVIYEKREEGVTLNKDGIKFLQNYLDLERQRN